LRRVFRVRRRMSHTATGITAISAIQGNTATTIQMAIWASVWPVRPRALPALRNVSPLKISRCQSQA
jgi:hypothetical protein